MKECSTDYILSTVEFSDFYNCVTAFCGFIESTGNEDNDFLKRCRYHLLNLYRTALALPRVKVELDTRCETTPDREQFQAIVSQISTRFQTLRYYWQVVDPFDDADHAPGLGDLVDDIADIYKDIKHSCLLFNLKHPNCKENALWQFTFDFDKHWGDHCINALNAIHFLIQKNDADLSS